MNKYELTVVLPGKATAAKQKSIRTKLEKIITTLKGKTGKAEELGKIDLAYKIKGESSGNFVQYPLELEANAARQVSDKLRLEGGVLRYLLIRKGK